MTGENHMVLTSRFVGREWELEVLYSVLEEAIRGQGGIVMLAGEPGVGKTRTAQELATYGIQLGAKVLWGACYEEEGAPPYWPWVQLLRSYVRESDPEQIRIEMGSGVSDIAEVVIEVREKVSDLRSPPTLEPEQARFRLFESMTTFLKNAAQSQPLVVVLDDLHWAESSSLMLLEYFAHQLAESPLLLVGTYRDMDLPRRHPLAQVMGNLVREQSYHKVQLGGFTQQEVQRFVEISSGVKPSPGLVQAIHQRTEGNPFFVAQVVRLLGGEEVGEEQGLNVLIPEGVRDAIGRRVGHLSQPCEQMLTVASVAGRECGLKLLEALMIAPKDQLLDAIDEALSAQLIEESPQSADLYRFTHALIQETLAAGLSRTRRVRLHARIAEALEEIYGVQAEAHASELAYHYDQAASVLGSEKLVRYSNLAGKQALAAYAHGEALAHFQRGFEARGPSECMDAEKAELMLGLGVSQIALLGLNHFQEAVENLTRAFDYYVEAGDLSKAGAIAQYPFPYWARRLPEVIHLIERTLAIVPSDSPSSGHLWSFYGQVLGVERCDYSSAQEAFQRALAIAHQGEDATLKVRTLAWSAITDCFHLHFKDSLEKSLTAIALAQECKDLQIEVDAYHWASVVMMAAGDLENASLKAAAGLSLAERIHDRQRLTSLLWVNAGVAQSKGDWESARRLSDRGLESWHQDPRLLGNRTVLEHQLGNASEGDHYLGRLVEVASLTRPELKTEQAILAMEIPLIATITGELKMADVCQRSARAVISSVSTSPLLAMIARFGLALLAVHRNDVAEARQHYVDLKSTVSGLVTTDLSGDRLLGLLSQTVGELDTAATHYDDAVNLCRRAGCRPELGWTCYNYAGALLQRGGAPDRSKAMSLLEESLTISNELGMQPLTERAAALKEQLELGPAAAPAYPDGLTQREIEVLLLIALGKSNREIAEELVISRNTVISHVSNIFNKIGATNRTEAATYANRHELLSW